MLPDGAPTNSPGPTVTPSQDGNAFARTLSELRGALQAFLRRRLGNSENVEDVVQETYLRALRYQNVSDRGELRALLLRIADNVVNDHYRRSLSQRMVELDESTGGVEMISQQPGPEQVQIGHEDWQRVKTAILHLSPRVRSAFVLHRFGQMSYREIAARHGTSIRTVENQVAAALSACRLALAKPEAHR